MYTSDNECDDGGPGAEFPVCLYGTDCIDCGPRVAPPPLPPHFPGFTCFNNCLNAGGGACSDGGPGSEFATCPYGSDCADCGPRVSMPSPPPKTPPPPSPLPFPPGSAPPPTPVMCSNTCPGYPDWVSDGDCDDGGPGAEFGDCLYGTDCTDCGPRVSVPPFQPAAPPPSPPHHPGWVCLNTCDYAGGGSCSDGGPGSEFDICPFGTDCVDCGPRLGRPPPPPLVLCGETCVYASDTDCDDGGPGSEFGDCALGTDCTDCGPRQPIRPPPPPPNVPGALCGESCLYTSDALCDDGGPGSEYAECTYGSDCADCGPRVPRPPPPMAICTKDCIETPSYASDGDCDGGGPGAEYLG